MHLTLAEDNLQDWIKRVRALIAGVYVIYREGLLCGEVARRKLEKKKFSHSTATELFRRKVCTNFLLEKDGCTEYTTVARVCNQSRVELFL